MQRNWIGRSKGVEMVFDLEQAIAGSSEFTVYTTRPDTIMGVTYVSLAAEHPIALELAKANPALAEFIADCKKQSVAEADMAAMEKKGMAAGINAKHPITGEPVPVWVANYVLMDYGSGAVMAVPAHDQRDYEFAQQYNLPIKQVIDAEGDLSQAAIVEKGKLINSGEAYSQFDGLKFSEAFKAISQHLHDNGKGRVQVNYRLRDWGVSRQRYWGCPIPMLNLADGTEIPVPAEKLPVLLPEDVEMDGVNSPIKSDPNWRKAEPVNGVAAEHETDTFDTFMESSWYYARFTCPEFADSMLDKQAADYWLPVDQYVGGIEHAILHLLYARFFHKLMRDENLVSSDEPFERLLCQGMVLAESFFKDNDDGSKTWFNPAEVTLEKDDKGKIIAASHPDAGDLQLGGTTKMSKSKNNGVDPQSAVEEYGADTVRLFTMFAAPPEQTLEWHDSGVEGAHRFLRRLWKTVHGHIEAGTPGELAVDALDGEQKQLRRKTHETIVKVSDDYQQRLTFNTAIAAVMELLNEVTKLADRANPEGLAVERESLNAMVLLLSPVVPHICHSLWRALGHTSNLVDETWPVADEAALVKDTLVYPVQVNGKIRAQLEVAASTEADEILAMAKAEANVAKFLEGKEIKMSKVIPGKLVTFAVK